jgi:hypothetical protein
VSRALALAFAVFFGGCLLPLAFGFPDGPLKVPVLIVAAAATAVATLLGAIFGRRLDSPHLLGEIFGLCAVAFGVVGGLSGLHGGGAFVGVVFGVGAFVPAAIIVHPAQVAFRARRSSWLGASDRRKSLANAMAMLAPMLALEATGQVPLTCTLTLATLAGLGLLVLVDAASLVRALGASRRLAAPPPVRLLPGEAPTKLDWGLGDEVEQRSVPLDPYRGGARVTDVIWGDASAARSALAINLGLVLAKGLASLGVCLKVWAN